MEKDVNMSDKILVLTGGSRGIGEKTIANFIAEGWKAINISRTPSKNNKVINLQIDLSNAANIHETEFKKHITAKSVIALVHNAAYYQRDAIDNLSLKTLNKTLETNIFSPIVLNQILIPLMLPSSVIIYIGSTLSEKGVPGSASYIVSKHALIGLMRATCQDLAANKIRSLCICPGLVDTNLLKETMDYATQKTLLATKVMANRLIQPEEIADVIYFCANTPVINGTVIHANLGQIAD